MRIIAGEFRGRPLLAPKSEATRPITDRAKQSLFDILSPLISEAAVYDCFAGTGSMGLECLSRGARHVTFFESDRSALGQLQKNISILGVELPSKVISADIFRWFSSARERSPEAAFNALPVQLIFLDPPYRYLNEQPTKLQQLADQMVGHMAPDAILVFRHDITDHLSLPKLTIVDLRDYGQMRIELLKRIEPE
jgi:16S rRNA (guanine966-N2)-methyltransferase